MSWVLRLLTRPPLKASPKQLAKRIAAVREELAVLEMFARVLVVLEERRRTQLRDAITAFVGPGVAFTAGELWAHRLVSPSLATALADADITSARQLGKYLKKIGLPRVSDEKNGALWQV